MWTLVKKEKTNQEPVQAPHDKMCTTGRHLAHWVGCWMNWQVLYYWATLGTLGGLLDELTRCVLLGDTWHTGWVVGWTDKFCTTGPHLAHWVGCWMNWQDLYYWATLGTLGGLLDELTSFVLLGDTWHTGWVAGWTDKFCTTGSHLAHWVGCWMNWQVLYYWATLGTLGGLLDELTSFVLLGHTWHTGWVVGWTDKFCTTGPHLAHWVGCWMNWQVLYYWATLGTLGGLLDELTSFVLLGHTWHTGWVAGWTDKFCTTGPHFAHWVGCWMNWQVLYYWATHCTLGGLLDELTSFVLLGHTWHTGWVAGWTDKICTTGPHLAHWVGCWMNWQDLYYWATLGTLGGLLDELTSFVLLGHTWHTGWVFGWTDKMCTTGRHLAHWVGCWMNWQVLYYWATLGTLGGLLDELTSFVLLGHTLHTGWVVEWTDKFCTTGPHLAHWVGCWMNWQLHELVTRCVHGRSYRRFLVANGKMYFI